MSESGRSHVKEEEKGKNPLKNLVRGLMIDQGIGTIEMIGTTETEKEQKTVRGTVAEIVTVSVKETELVTGIGVETEAVITGVIETEAVTVILIARGTGTQTENMM